MCFLEGETQLLNIVVQLFRIKLYPSFRTSYDFWLSLGLSKVIRIGVTGCILGSDV